MEIRLVRSYLTTLEHSVRAMDNSLDSEAPQNATLETSISTNRSNSMYLDDEPWDERPPGSRQHVRSPLMACVESADQLMRDRMSCEFYDRQADDDALEDGDLPTLSLKNKRPPVGGRLVGGQLTTARPMSPPSTAGLVPTDMDGTLSTTSSNPPKPVVSPATLQKKHNQFWSQLDPPSPEDVEENNDDVPEDELEDRALRRRWVDDSSRNRDEVETVDRSERPRVAAVETDSNSEANDDNFCDYTLQTLGNICSGGTESPQRSILPTKARKSTSVNRSVAPTYDVYEHTAIEVEYVEPQPPVDSEEKKEDRDESSVTSGSWTPNRKNAYLATMARKAKEDFEKSQAQKDRANLSGAESPVPASPRSVSQDKEQDSLPDDVYNSFSATEKRKFLKLINSGLTSTESIKQVLAERKAGEEQSPQLEESESFGSKPTERGKMFSFWKKTSNKSAMQRARSAPKARPFGALGYEAAPTESSVNGGYKSAPTSPMVATRGATEAISVKQTLENVAGGQSLTALSVQAVSSESKSDMGPQLPNFEATVAVAKAAKSPPLIQQVQVTKESSLKPGTPKRGREETVSATAPQVVPHAIAVAAATTTAVMSRDTRGLSELEDDNEGQDRFARSGIKYYDAVDKDRPEEEDDVDEEEELEVASQSKSKSRTARLASIRLNPKAQGFSSLAEKNDKTDQRARSRSLAEINRSATISPDGLRRRTLLGIPLPTAVSPTSFAALQDESTEIELPDEQVNQNDTQEGRATMEPVVKRVDLSSPREVPFVVAESSTPAGIHSVESSLAGGVEEVAMQRVETELLRPIVPSTGISQVYDDEGQSTVQSDLDLASPSSLSLQPSPNNRMGRVEITGMDLGIDTYLDSTNIFAGGADHMSVISGRSGWTTGTGITGATMSSRKRRPGAAKERLAKAKEAENVVRSTKGWHESIRAAAASTNRVWDPEKGWVDYKDPQAEAHGERKGERLRISLDTVSLASQKGGAMKSQPEVATRSPPVKVPFPEKWERERSEMINGDKVSKPDASDANRVVLSGMERTLSPTGVSRQGAVISPVRGSQTTSGVMIPSVGRSRENTPVRSHAASSNLDRSTDSTLSGTVRSVGRSAEGTAGRGYLSIEQGDVSVGDLTEPMSNLNDWIEQSVDGMASKSELSQLSTQDSVTVVTVDRSGGKYMQLGDNGSVKSLLHDPPPKTTNSLSASKKSLFANNRFATPDRQAKIDEENDVENDALPLLQVSSGRVAKAPEVDVVKEMCDEGDIDLFNSRVTESVENNNVTMGSPSSRRSGPVDVDEVDDMSSSSDEDDEAWEADPFMLGIVSPSLLVRKRDSQTSNSAPAISPSNSGDGSFNLPVSASRAIPKLSKSKKDTSPVRDTQSSIAVLTKRGRPASHGPQRVSDQQGVVSVLHSDQLLPPNDVLMSKSTSKGAGSTRERSEIAHKGAASSDADALLRPVDLDLDATRVPSAAEEMQMDTSGRSASSIVKLRAQQWETRSTISPVNFANNEEAAAQLSPGGVSSGSPLLRGATAEWKSFLGKKVQTESAVAARQQENLKTQSSRVAKEPEGGHFSPVNKPTSIGFDGNEQPVFDKIASEAARGRRVDEERDSLFDFEHSSNAKRGLRREREIDQSENVYVDASHTRVENRDGHDVNAESGFGLDGDRAEVEREYVESEAGTVDKGSFLQRLKACAATDFPAAHLAFMRTNAGVKNISSRFMPATLCGTPDVILKDDDTDDGDRESLGTEQQFPESIRGKPRSRSTPRIEIRPSSSSSVFSEEFGAKTAYLDAIAAKYAVSKPKKSDSRRREGRRSSASDVSVSSRRSQQSEKWQAFLERKSAAGASPTKSRASSSTEISQAAEKYAAEKVEEIMAAMSSSRSKSTPRSWPSQQMDNNDPRYRVGELIDSDNISTGSSSSPLPHEMPKTPQKYRNNDSARAAEELAAARVEAMMAAMSSSRDLDEGEI